MKQSPSKLGITITGRGHDLRLAREMNDVRLRNMILGRVGIEAGKNWEIHHSLVCQSRHQGTGALAVGKAIPVPA